MTIKFSISFLFVLLFQINVFAQSPYEVNWKNEVPYMSTGIATFGLGAYLRSQDVVFTPDEILILNANDINSFDRFATDNFSIQADHASDVFWFGSAIAPFLFLTNEKSKSHFGQILVLYGEATTINFGLTVITKSFFNRTRPFAYNPEVAEEMKLKRNARTALVSGHTSITACNTFFAAQVFSDFYPDSRWKPLIWGAAATIPAITGYLRVAAGKHFPTDVMAGYAMGAAIGILVPRLHRNKGLKDKGISLNAGMDKVHLVWQFGR